MELSARVAAAASLALLCLSAAAMAQDAGGGDLINPDRPGIADGSRVIGAARLQIETSLQSERHRNDGVTSHALFFPTLVRVGVTDRLELRVEGNTFTHASGASGLAPLSIGAKLAVLAPQEGTSLGLIVRAFPASGTGDFKTNHFTTDVRVAADIPLSVAWSLNPNAGIARYEGNDSGTYTAGLLAMTLNYQPTPKLNPFVDAGFQSSSGRGSGAAIIVDAGVAWIVGSNVQFDVSIGQGLDGDVPRPFVAAGVSLRTGRATRRPTASARRTPLVPR